LNKNKKKSKKNRNDGDSDNDDDDDEATNMSKQKVLDWPARNTANNKSTQNALAVKKFRKGYQKKQNIQL